MMWKLLPHTAANKKNQEKGEYKQFKIGMSSGTSKKESVNGNQLKGRESTHIYNVWMLFPSQK